MKKFLAAQLAAALAAVGIIVAAPANAAHVGPLCHIFPWLWWCAPPTPSPTPSPTPVPTPTTTTPTTMTTPTPVPNGIGPTGVPGNWAPTFDDEFNGTALDTSKWQPCWTYGSCIGVNGVATDPNNVSVSGGQLHLKLSTSADGATVTTQQHFFFHHGDVIEARMRDVVANGQCADWGGFWTSNDSGTADEDDVAENLQGYYVVHHHGTPEFAGSYLGGKCDGQFHTYTLQLRTDNSAVVYYDGQAVEHYPLSSFNPDEYILLTIGNGQGNPTVIGGTLDVDYVRAWSPAQ